MAETTGIGWCDATFNPWVGCAKVSPGCAHCYAETLVTGRMDRPGTWGEDGVRERTSESNWKKPLRWQRLAEQGFLPDGKTKADHRPRVFCASLADVFEPRAELAPWREELFSLIAATPALDWLVLTKRAEEARDWLSRRYAEENSWLRLDGLAETGPLPNLWVGVSIENNRFTWRADVLREIPAAVRFISAEPLLGSLFKAPSSTGRLARAARDAEGETPDEADHPRGVAPLDLTGIDWVIVGGESGGRDSRPMHPEWAREIRDACQFDAVEHPYDPAGPAFFFKQWGSWEPDIGVGGEGKFVGVDGRSVDGMILDAIPDVLPEPVFRMRYAGSSPKSGGKLLDGREWMEFPCEFPRDPVIA